MTNDETLLVDVFDGQHTYIGTHQEIATQLLDQIDPATVDLMTLAALVHDVVPLDVMAVTMNAPPFGEP